MPPVGMNIREIFNIVHQVQSSKDAAVAEGRGLGMISRHNQGQHVSRAKWSFSDLRFVSIKH